jgi:hypothetical protein
MYATHLDLSLALYKAIKKIQVKTTRYIQTCRMFYVSVQTTRRRVSICLIEVRLYSTVSTNLITGLVSSKSYAQSYLLLEHLRKAYSAAKASRRIKLLRLVWRTVIEEGEDPSKAMGDMREAFNDLNGAASLDNKASFGLGC